MKLIAGVDEAGRGPLAGPVVAAVAVFKSGYRNRDIKDSKQLSAKIREELVDVIKAEAVQWAIVAVGHHRIERLNILRASVEAMSLCVARVRADIVLVDGNVPISCGIPQRTVVGGDSLHVQISAASILAKVYRDRLMKVLDGKYPGYEFSRHAGYPTEVHREAIARLGPCPVHRRSFQGVREYLQESAPTLVASGSEGREDSAALS